MSNHYLSVSNKPCTQSYTLVFDRINYAIKQTGI